MNTRAGSQRVPLTRFFTPRSLPALHLWLAADQITGLVDGDPVTTWHDLSGNGFHATQTTAGSKPTYKVNILNGKPVVRFDGTADYMDTVSNLIIQPFSFVAVGIQTSKATAARFLDANIPAGDPRAILGTRQTTGLSQINAGASVNGAVDRSGAWHIFRAFFNTTLSTIHIDGLLDAGPADVGSRNHSTTRIGADNALAAAAFLTGDIAELVITTKPLTPYFALLLDRYFSLKYRITLLGLTS